MRISDWSSDVCPSDLWSALMRAVRRLLWRAALFLWIRPRALNPSSSGWADLEASWAPTAALASSALRTFFTEVRSIQRWRLFRRVRPTACLAALLRGFSLVHNFSFLARGGPCWALGGGKK